MKNYSVTKVHISEILNGDTILYNGEIKTVSRCNISKSEFMGICIFGDSYKLGSKPVEKIAFNQL